jgi:tetratricopeptide (TPR) repeat protein
MLKNICYTILIGLSLLNPATAAPDDPAAKAYLAGDFRKAKKLLEAEIAEEGARSSRYLLLSRIYFAEKEWKKATKTLDVLLADDPGNPHARELMGRTLFQLKELKQALPYYEESLRESESPELRLEFVEILTETGQRTRAIASLRKVIQSDQSWPRAHYLLGKLRLEEGIGHWSANELWIALKLGCKEKDLRFLLAQAFFLESRITGPMKPVGPLKDAEVGSFAAERLIVRPAGIPDRPDFWYASEPDTAIYQIESTLRDAGKTASEEMYTLAARCWLAAEDSSRAAALLSNVKRESTEALLLRLEIAAANTDIEAFKALLKSPLQNDAPPDELAGHCVDMALAAQVQGDLSAALDFLQKADELLPGQSQVLRHMADVLRQLGRTSEAQSKILLLSQLHPDSPELRVLTSRYAISLEEAQESSF